jgi:aromatic-L-amino-acid decarboxylase
MEADEFRRHGYALVDWIADYLDHAERYPVLAQVDPGEIRDRLPDAAPHRGEPMDRILDDFRSIILPGVTHWNHPRFFAYFPANNSGPAILGELLSAGLGVNAMMWQTCPAATELEQVVMDWLRAMIGLPAGFRGAIQDTASSATICALLCARERTTGFAVNASGFAAVEPGAPLRVYASAESHSSVDKGAKIAGFGAENVVPVAVDRRFAMDRDALRRAIDDDLAAGRRPCAVVATVGTTGSTAVDPLRHIGEIAAEFGLWLHVDAALAGSAAILPEKRWLLEGAELCHSLVFNPHKWLFTNFDCSAFFTREPDARGDPRHRPRVPQDRPRPRGGQLP